jgi:hypothetical protein
MPIHNDQNGSSVGANDRTDDVQPTLASTPPPFTRRTVKSLTAKRVCFSAGVRCRFHLHINDFTDEEYFGTFYQQDEYDRMMIALIHHQHQKQLLQRQCPDTENRLWRWHTLWRLWIQSKLNGYMVMARANCGLIWNRQPCRCRCDNKGTGRRGTYLHT